MEELPLDAPEKKRIPLLLRRAWYGMNQAFRRKIAHLDLTPDQFTLLRNLTEGDAKGLTQRTLTKKMSSDPNTISALLKRMEANGLLKRNPHENDRRAHRIKITAKGEKIYSQARVCALDLQQQILESIPPDAVEGFLQNLELIANTCKTAADEALLEDENQ